MREGGADAQVLLVRRHERTSVNAGVFVFPGGLLEPQDYSEDALSLAGGLSLSNAAEVLGTAASAERAFGHFLAAIRETFEEVGILLAHDSAGRPWLPDAHDRAALTEARAAMRARRITFASWLKESGLYPAFGELHYFAHWITPEAMQKRFDTRFFLARAADAQLAEPDHAEVDECRWIAPGKALAAWRAGSMRMVNATVKNLERLDGCADFAAARGLCERAITAILPKAVPEGEGFRIVNPWESGYEAL